MKFKTVEDFTIYSVGINSPFLAKQFKSNVFICSFDDTITIVEDIWLQDFNQSTHNKLFWGVPGHMFYSFNNKIVEIDGITYCIKIVYHNSDERVLLILL
jgi:hypothetical protein